MEEEFTGEDLMDHVYPFELYQGAELQLIVGNTAFCVYRKKTYVEKYGYYAADVFEMEGPSGRKHATRMSWNRQPPSARTMSLEEMATEIKEQLESGEMIDGAWLVNPSNHFQRWEAL